MGTTGQGTATGSTAGGLLRRDRLQATLDRALRGGAALVVAPGGAGKTSLARAWAEGAPVPVAWHGAGGADRDPRRLLDGLCRALGGIGADTGPAAAALGAGGTGTRALDLLLAGLGAGRAALVLDDLHRLEGAPEAEALVGRLLGTRPPGLGLVLLSRAVPAMAFGGTLAGGGVAGLGGADLAFDEEEASALLEAHGLEPGEGEGGALAGRAGGWAAGILLMARAPTRGLRLSKARKEAQLDALCREIADGLPPDLATFLEESAALGEGTAAGTDLALGRRDSEARYEEALERGLFLQEAGGIYRYHDLFRDWLVGRLRTRDPGRLSALARAAAGAAAGAGDVPRALAGLAAAGEWAALAGMLEERYLELWAGGHHETVIRLVGGLPPDLASPGLRLIAGFALSGRGEYAAALRAAREVLPLCPWPAPGDDPGDGEALLMPLRAARLESQSLLLGGRYEEAAATADAALGRAGGACPERQAASLREMRGVARGRLGPLADGLADLEWALASALRRGDTLDEVRILHNLGVLQTEAGRPKEALDWLARARARMGGRPDLARVQGSLMARSMALALAMGGRGEEALAEARDALARARATGRAYDTGDSGTTLAELLAEAGGTGGAGETGALLAEMAGLARELDSAPLWTEVDRVAIKLALAAGDRAGGTTLLAAARARAPGGTEMARLAALEGMLSLRAGAHGRARGELAGASDRLLALGRPQEAVRALLLLAEACLADGARTAAEEHLNRLGALARGAEFEGHLGPMAPYAPRCLAAGRALRRLGIPARDLLDGLAGGSVPAPGAGRGAPAPAGGAGAGKGKGKGEETAPGARPVLRLSPFGEGRAWLGGEPLDLATLPPRARELLFLAGREPDAPLARDRLLDLVWDGEKGGEAGLWDAGRALRRVLGTGRWARGADGYRLVGPLEDDEAAFLAAAAEASGRGTAAARLRAADRAVTLAGGGGYLEWCGAAWAGGRRAACARALVGAAGVAAALHAAASRGEAALAAARVATAADPGDEGACRALCAILQGLGRPGEARAARAAHLLLAGAAGGGD